jgi:hypothetical protein
MSKINLTNEEKFKLAVELSKNYINQEDFKNKRSAVNKRILKTYDKCIADKILECYKSIETSINKVNSSD